MANKIYATQLLREWREGKGYTQPEMTALLGIEMGRDIAISTYQKWEQGTLNLTPDNALEISRFTRIELKDLVARR